ncbi:hypothetical protein DDZ18_01380 [Marinicauda salina]|uniref:Uncharacterized protein n=1 Tax=Marinicauda salina TaxID=2135793 RepID=A0A2U2BWB4_9PROT|nr:hypothetical protein [Marinicauda salina]PWE18287.1 hypothetical protein DDZ18_01380 [Marinicauda salina]
MTRDELKSDIDYLRELAEAGEAAPLLGGRFALWWGGLATLVLLAHWTIVSGRAPLGVEALWPLWLGFIVIGSIGSAFLGLSLRGKPGAGSVGNRVEGAVWPSAGLAIFAYFLGVTAGVLTGQLSPVFYNTILPAALLGYSVSWMTMARIVRRPVLFIPAGVALAGVAAAAALAATHWVYLVTAAAIFGSTVAPGLVLMTREPRTVV